jgi:AmmeMemoRadiSam system protein A
VQPGLSLEARRSLLRLARETLVDVLAGRPADRWAGIDPDLARAGAAFVTLRERHGRALRGCRGEVHAKRPLADSVIEGAIAAALDDPRFAPVGAAELAHLTIEISALSPLVPIRAEEIEVGRHGVLIRMGGRGGLLLPQVAVEQRWNREELLRGVCQKAGLPIDAWRSPAAQLFAFEAAVWGEDDLDAASDFREEPPAVVQSRAVPPIESGEAQAARDRKGGGDLGLIR